MFADFCIWLATRNWRRLAVGAVITYVFMLVGALGADLINSSKVPRLPAIIGYLLLIASYAATAIIWSHLRLERRQANKTTASYEAGSGRSPLQNASD